MAGLWQSVVKAASRASLRRESLGPQARLGREGEEVAYWRLRESGFVMVARNYRPQGSHREIDLIGWDGDTLVFVEVKTRQPSSLLAPESAVDRQKEALLKAAARDYRREARCAQAPFRFDIVSVEPAPDGPHIRHFKDAFR